MPITESTALSSTPSRKVVLPLIRNPPVDAILVTKYPALVSEAETSGASSLCTTARIIFIF
jgi:hypothetical protein